MSQPPDPRICPHCGAANAKSLIITLCASCRNPLDGPAPQATESRDAEADRAPAAGAIPPPPMPALPPPMPRAEVRPPARPTGASPGCSVIVSVLVAGFVLWTALSWMSSLTGRRPAPRAPRHTPPVLRPMPVQPPRPPPPAPPRPPAPTSDVQPDQVRSDRLGEPLLPTAVLFYDTLDSTPPKERWKAKAGQWIVEGGGLRGQSAERAVYWAAAAPMLSNQEAAVTVIFRQHLRADQWGLAGLALGTGDGEFWCVGVVQAPKGDRYCEIVESHRGQWMAQGARGMTLPGLPGGILGARWEYGRPYRLTLTLRPDRVSAEVRDGENGPVIFRHGFGLPPGADAVRQGRVGLLVGAAAATFDGVQVVGPK